MNVAQNGESGYLYRGYAAVRQLSGGRLNGEFVATTVVSPTELRFETEVGVATVIDSAQLTPILAERGVLASGYILDPKSGVAISDVQTTMTVGVPRGPGSTAGFPDAPGYVVLNFGTATQSAVLRYLGTASSTQLRLTAGQLLTSDYDVGSTVTLLVGTGPYAPADAGRLGVTYVTASSVGRIEAIKDIEFAQAAGLNIIQNVLYPSDRGLGNAGFPTSGADKLSDAVVVWGGDDIDAEVAEARK